MCSWLEKRVVFTSKENVLCRDVLVHLGQRNWARSFCTQASGLSSEMENSFQDFVKQEL